MNLFNSLRRAVREKLWLSFFVFWSAANVMAQGAGGQTERLDWIQISKNKTGFELASSGQQFTPFGFNYDRDYKMRLLEDYWETEWQTVVEDFREMKDLGANVARIHLQFGKFMMSPKKPDQRALHILQKLLALAEETGLYLDLTGLACYRKQDVPAWFDALSEKERWAAQANFWKAIAKTCAKSRAIFCYDLINEPFVSGGKASSWYSGHLAGFNYCQTITLDPDGRNRSELATKWVRQMTAAIRKHDQRHLITVGLLPEIRSGFAPLDLAPHLDFISVHIYPENGKMKEALHLVKEFSVGKPVVIEELFPMKCGAEDLQKFILESQKDAAGWIGFYWGQTSAELREVKSISAAMTMAWLKLFQETQRLINPERSK